MRKNIKYILLLIIACSLFFLIKSAAPQQIIWDATYSAKDKNPYGNYILYKELNTIFPNHTITSSNKTIYEVINYDLNYSTYTSEQGISAPAINYIFINADFSLNQTETEIILNFVKNGGQVFISAEFFPKGIWKDSLHLNTDYSYAINNKTDSSALNFIATEFKSASPYFYKNGSVDYFFNAYDTLHTTVLGINQQGKPTFIKTTFGEGNFFLSSTPKAFTNYNILLHKNHEYIAKCFSYLPVQNVYWDEYYKVGRGEEQSIFRFILSNPPLRWGFYLTLASIVLFMLFEAKRKQRIIPIIIPPQNTTLEFTETVGQLYYQNRDHKNIADKKIAYFLDFIRTQFFIKTNEINEEVLAKIAQKSGQKLEEVKGLFHFIKQIQQNNKLDEAMLWELHHKIEAFKTKIHI